MSLFYNPEEEVVVSSPMEGVITFNGKPAIGAKVERKLKWKDENGETDIVYTDDKGYFNLPIVKDIVKIGKTVEFVMAQEVLVHHDGSEYTIWVMGKGSKKLYGELGGKPSNFRCELTEEDIPLTLDDALLLTKCKWDEIVPSKGE